MCAAKSWESFTNQRQWREYLTNLLKTNDRALLKAITIIYDFQTDEEKLKGAAIDENDRGFGKVDARDLGRMAEKIRANIPLTEGELARARNKMPKYWQQLMRVSKAQTSRQRLSEQVGFQVQVEPDGQIKMML